MKYFCLLMLLFFVGCSPNIHKYKVCESCYTEEDVLKTLKSYILNVETYYKDWEIKAEIYDFGNIYYLNYSPVMSNDRYVVRGCTFKSVIIRKRDCKVLYFGPNC